MNGDQCQGTKKRRPAQSASTASPEGDGTVVCNNFPPDTSGFYFTFEIKGTLECFAAV